MSERDVRRWVLPSDPGSQPAPAGVAFVPRSADQFDNPVYAGDGIGYGNAIGGGSGDGEDKWAGAVRGNGEGFGNGEWTGYARRPEPGDAPGTVRGYGYGDEGANDAAAEDDRWGEGWGVPNVGGRAMPEVGKNQLIVLPHGWVICGYVEEQTGPYSFRVRDAHVICRTNGVPWDELADGGRRHVPTYRRWGTVTIGPQFVMSREWVGSLPAAGAT